MEKSFRELSTEEATELARQCVRGAKSEAQIRERLTAAGFDGASAAIHTSDEGDYGLQAMVMVHGPQGETISA